MTAIFLTGAPGVGKTTLIQRFLRDSGLSADGFQTYWEKDEKGAETGLWLAPFGADPATGPRRLLARICEDPTQVMPNITDIFDLYGAGLLDRSGERDLIVMDELGKFESAAPDFQQAVLRRLDGPVPVLGVVRDMQTDFLDTVRAQVKVIRVDQTNRDTVLAQLLQQTWTPGR
ncbi:MAG: nucleoside-triphosphatase [Propionibacteriaceae bacterium]|nr:nucleoside-triphosphatase [Propionibacteriaceae bacterium]